MPLMLPFKRAGIHERVLQAFVYPAVLTLAVLVLVPFALMILMSLGDPEDSWKDRKWPALGHLFDKKKMYVRYLTTRYDYWPSMLGFNYFYGTKFKDNELISDIKEVPSLSGNWKVRAEDGLACLKADIPWTHTWTLFSGWAYYAGGKTSILRGFTGMGERIWKDHLREKYGKIDSVNVKFSTGFATFDHVKTASIPTFNQRPPFFMDDPWMREYTEFLADKVPTAWRLIERGDRWYRYWLGARPDVRENLIALNTLIGTTATAWEEIKLSETVPGDARERPYWEEYVRTAVCAYVLEVGTDEEMQARYRKFLADRHGSAEAVKEIYGKPLEELVLPATAVGITDSGTRFHDWDDFVRSLPVEMIRVRTPEVIWKRFITAKYGTIGAANAAWSTTFTGFAQVPWPQMEIDRLDWKTNRVKYVGEMVFGNYKRAWSLMTEATPALINTARFAIIFGVLSVVVNAGAAYILSRFAMSSLQMFLVYFLALAAFPIEALAVPNFLLLRNLGLLNTVWALTLPMLVNGYYIYLLKSYFDSIPRDYFEEAMIYGAGELTMFWKVAIPLARPMLVVVGLYSFLWAYSNFLWTLIVCQQRTEWTLPVLIFNMNAWEPAGALLAAAMVITSVPPLLVFIFANRTLERSLTLPHH